MAVRMGGPTCCEVGLSSGSFEDCMVCAIGRRVAAGSVHDRRARRGRKMAVVIEIWHGDVGDISQLKVGLLKIKK